MIVARGLGRGVGAILVTAGLGLSGAPVPPAVPPVLAAGPDDPLRRVLTEDQIRVQNDIIIMTVIAAVTSGLIE